MLNRNPTFSLALTDKILRREALVVAICALVPVIFEVIHLLGVTDSSPLGFLSDAGRANFLSLMVVVACAGFPLGQWMSTVVGGALIALTVGFTDDCPLLVNIASCIGICAIPLLGFHLFRGDKRKAEGCLWGWLPFLFLALAAPMALKLGTLFYSRWVYDGVLFMTEKRMFGGNVAFILFHKLEILLPGMNAALDLIYHNLNVLIAVVIGFGVRYNYQKLSLPLFFIVSGLVAGLAYGLMPTMGPKYAILLNHGVVPFGRFEVLEDIPKNGIPSLHFGWSLALALISFDMPNKGLRKLCALFCFLTALSTMATGEHYLIDLVIGAPFILAVYLSFRVHDQSSRRDGAFKLYTFTLLLWYAGLLLNILPNAPALLLWACVLMTAAACWYVFPFRERADSALIEQTRKSAARTG